MEVSIDILNILENFKVTKQCHSVYRYGGPAGIPEDQSSDRGIWTGKLSITGVYTQVCLLKLNSFIHASKYFF